MADLDTLTITGTAGATVLTRHQRRWVRCRIFTDPAHVSRAIELCRDYRTSMARKPSGQAVVQERDLSDCEQASGWSTPVTLSSWLKPCNDRPVKANADKVVQYYARALRAPRIEGDDRHLS